MRPTQPPPLLCCAGSGFSCYVRARRYNFRVASSGKNATGEMWSGVVVDTSTGKKLQVGTLFYPNLPGKTGFGNFKVQSGDFLEYFLGGTCDGAVTAQVGVQGTFAAHGC